MRTGAALVACAALLAAWPSSADVVDVRCPNGVRFMGERSQCPCCPWCEELGARVAPGEECPPPRRDPPRLDPDKYQSRTVVLDEKPARAESGTSDGESGPFSFLVMMAALYFVPAIVAASRRHHQRDAILVLNLFLGWTVLGWIAALVWAATAVRKDPARPQAT